MTSPRLAAEAFDQLFLKARTYPKFLDRSVSVETLKEIHSLLRMAPTASNCQSGRFVFVTSPEGKDRLIPALMEGNVAKVRSAPVTVIVATDARFFDRLPELWHDPGAKDYMESHPDHAKREGFRNACLQGGYLIMAARALGLDCGPMSGFHPDVVNKEFFSGDMANWKANFLINLGYGDPQALYPRGPRPDFDSVCRLV